MVFNICLAIGLLLGFIFVFCVFVCFMIMTFVEIQNSIKDKDIFFIIFGMCAMGLEIVGTVIYIFTAYNVMNSLIKQF